MKCYIKKKDNLQEINELLIKIEENIVLQKELFSELKEKTEYAISNKSKEKYIDLNQGSDKVITGVRQFAKYIHKSPATAQKILNSNILQDHRIAYKIGNTWNINIDCLDRLIAEDPQILHC